MMDSINSLANTGQLHTVMKSQSGAQKSLTLIYTILVCLLWNPINSLFKEELNYEMVIEDKPLDIEITEALISPTNTKNEENLIEDDSDHHSELDANPVLENGVDTIGGKSIEEKFENIRVIRNADNDTKSPNSSERVDNDKAADDKSTDNSASNNQINENPVTTKQPPERFDMKTFILVSVPTACSLFFLMCCCIFCTRSGSCLCPQ